MIEIKNVSKKYVKDKKVIDNLSFKVNDGEIFGFLGPNGAGKTTTIKMITGILEIDDGDILVDNKSITQLCSCKNKHNYINKHVFSQFFIL